MKTVGDKLAPFAVTGVKPGQPEDAFYTITDESFEGKWKVTGSTDNEFCKVAWQKAHSDLQKITHHQFADTQRGELSLIEQLGVFYAPAGAALRATFIVDPENTIQHVTVNNLNVGRSPEETLRVLDALQTGELCACNRTVGGDTL